VSVSADSGSLHAHHPYVDYVNLTLEFSSTTLLLSVNLRKSMAAMKIVSESIGIESLREMASSFFGNMVKAVVDADRELIAIDAEMHSDLESVLLQDGSMQQHLWGVNLYPDEPDDKFVEFDSMINVRPHYDNRTRGVESQEIRDKILSIVAKRVRR
jgi:Protein of unknown function (DUF5674)